MKLYFTGAEALMDGITFLAPDLGFEVAEDAAYRVAVKETEENALTLAIQGEEIAITYGGGKSRFFRALGLLVQALKDGCTEKTLTETPLFKTNGSMVDMSRNAVMTVDTVKFMLRKMALFGMNTYMLYTEDTYEIESRPYFGHMRGRYTKEEIKEMDSYALKLGIELVPCIQVLGHLGTHLRWADAAKYKDTANVVLVGEEETYKLIDEMMSSIAECFTSRRIHLGMDETADLGLGGYLKKNGFRDHTDIYFEHLAKVVEMAQGYGFTPMMWSDMFFRMAGGDLPNYRDYDPRVVLPENTADRLPEGVELVFWDYYNPDEEFYAVNLDKHINVMKRHTLFAGGVWAWSGHAVQYTRSIRNTIPALEACKKAGTKEVIATVWHNGAEACHLMALAGFAMYAEYDYTGSYDEEGVKACVRRVLGIEYEDFLRTEDVEYPHGKNYYAGMSRSLLFNDPLLGLVDRHIQDVETENYYKKCSEQLAVVGEDAEGAAAKDGAMFAPAFEVMRRLSSVLEMKADFGVRLKEAYDAKDTATLALLYKECDKIMARIAALRLAHRSAWMKYYKSFGWEVFDIRYGGLMQRFDTTKMLLGQYIRGVIAKIDELEEDRLWLEAKSLEGDAIGGRFLWQRYDKLATTGVLP